jgi:lipooligosaccharide transport system permease protein
MFLFSGTFFPIDTLPGWAQTVAWTLPLTHLVALARVMTFGVLSWRDALVSGGYLLALTAVCFPLALMAMRRRLIK